MNEEKRMHETERKSEPHTIRNPAIHTLPLELLELILYELSIDIIGCPERFMLVCKRWHEAFLTYARLWSSIHLSSIPPYRFISSYIKAHVTYSRDHSLSIQLRILDSQQLTNHHLDEDDFDLAVQTLAPSIKRWSDASLWLTSDQRWSSIFASLKCPASRLRHLEFVLFVPSTSPCPKEVNQIFTYTPLLETISLLRPGGQPLSMEFPIAARETVVKLDFRMSFFNQIILHTLRQFPHLTTLDMRGFYGEVDEGPVVLRSLEAIIMRRATVEDLFKLFDSIDCPAFRHLQLEGFYCFTHVHGPYTNKVSQSLSHLLSLTFNDMPLRGLEFILSTISKLNRLTISGGVSTSTGGQVTIEDLERKLLKMKVLPGLRSCVIDGVERCHSLAIGWSHGKSFRFVLFIQIDLILFSSVKDDAIEYPDTLITSLN